jgi:hypothetical protein
MTIPEQADLPHPSTAQTTASAIVENAGRLGLTWDLKPATVSTIDPLTIIYDDDTVAVGATSMIGGLTKGTRVYALVTPPSGNFVTGIIGTPALSVKTIGSAYWVGGTTAGSTGTEVALSSWTASAPFTIGAGRVGELHISAGIISNSALVSATVIIVRKVLGSTSAQAIGAAQYITPAGAANIVPNLVQFSYIKNLTSKDVTFNPGISAIRTAGSGTNSLFGDATIPMSIVATDIGAATDDSVAGILGLAASLT